MDPTRGPGRAERDAPRGGGVGLAGGANLAEREAGAAAGGAAPTCGPGGSDAERARGAEGAERVGVGPAGREAWEWAMRGTGRCAGRERGRWAAAGSGHPWGKREVGSRAGRGERAQGRRPR